MATIKGKWLFNEIVVATYDGELPYWGVSFISNGVNYVTIGAEQDSSGNTNWIEYCTEASGFDGSLAYSISSATGWVDEVYRTVDFGEIEQTVDDEFYTWLTTNAVQQINEEGSLITVTYNNNEIASLEVGQSVLLACAGKKMASDVIITVSVSPSIEPVGDITFTIDGAKYYADDGMTWEEWVESDYNTAGFAFADMNIMNDDATLRVCDETTKVMTTDTIVPNFAYTLQGAGGSND